MASLAARTLTNLAVALAAIGVYHVGFGAPPAAPQGEAEIEAEGGTSENAPPRSAAVEALARRAAAVRAEFEGAPGRSGPASRAGAQMASLERRLSALERGVTAGRQAPPSAADGESPRPWTPARIEALDSILDELDMRDLEVHEKGRWPALLEAFSPGLEPDAKRAATDLLATFFVRVRGAFESDGQGYVYDAPPSAVEAAVRARAEALDALRSVVPEALARRLDAELPRFPVDPATRLRRPSGQPRKPRR